MFPVRRVLLLTVAALLMVGCIGGLPSPTPPTPSGHTVTVTVLDGGVDEPIAGAQVELVGEDQQDGTTNAQGVVEFENVSGEVELLVTANGYQEETTAMEVTEDRSVEVKLFLVGETPLALDLPPWELCPCHFILAVENAQTGEPVTDLVVGYRDDDSGKIMYEDREVADDFDFRMTGPDGAEIPLMMVGRENEEQPGEYMIYADNEYRLEGGFELGVEYTITVEKEGYATTSITFVFLELSVAERWDIYEGEENSTVRLELVGASFVDAVEDLANWDIDYGDTGLILQSVERVENRVVDLSFAGTAQRGERPFMELLLDAAALDVNQDAVTWISVLQAP